MLPHIRRTAAARSAARDAGTSTIEYGLFFAAIAAIAIALVFAIGAFVQDSFERPCDGLTTEQSATATDC